MVQGAALQQQAYRPQPGQEWRQASPQCAAENFDHQNFDEQRRILRIRECCRAAHNADAQPVAQDFLSL